MNSDAFIIKKATTDPHPNTTGRIVLVFGQTIEVFIAKAVYTPSS